MNTSMLAFGMATPPVIEQAHNDDGSQQSPAAAPQAPARDTGVLKLKGLPYNTNKEALIAFFQDYKVKRVEFVFEPDGRPSGLAFAEFESREEAIRAMSKNGQYIGDRYVKLLLVSHQEMTEQITLGTLAIPSKTRGAAGNKGKAFARSFGTISQTLGHGFLPTAQLPLAPVNFVVTSAPPFGAEVAGGQHDRRDGAGPMGQAYLLQPRPPPQLGQQLGHQQLGPPQLVHQQLMRPPQLQPQFVYPHGAPMQQLPAHIGAPDPSSGVDGQQPALQNPMQNSMQNPMQGMQNPMQGMQNLMQPAGMNQGPLQYQLLLLPPGRQVAAGVGAYSGRTIKMRGLPFKSTPNEVLHFFIGYQFMPETLFMGRDAYGRPSGEAWLAFVSAEEALRAVADRNRQYLRNRYLELSLC